MNKIYMKNNGKSDGFDELIKKLNTLESNFPRTIKNNIFNYLLYKLDEKSDFINECETPIEVLIGLEIKRELDYLNGGNGLYYYLSPQHEIEIDDNKYRVDFLLAPIMKEDDTKYPNIVIECDGHNYHERTKEQAIKDRSRDRNLQKKGYRVIRFTGSEIFHGPKRCASEVIGFVKQVEKELSFGDRHEQR